MKITLFLINETSLILKDTIICVNINVYMLNIVKCCYTWYAPQTQIPTLCDSDCACDSDVSFPVLFTCFRVSPNGDPTPNKCGRFKVVLQELSEPSSHTISAYSSLPIISFVFILYKLKYSLNIFQYNDDNIHIFVNIPGSKMIQKSVLNVCSNPENLTAFSWYNPKIETNPILKENMVTMYNIIMVNTSHMT